MNIAHHVERGRACFPGRQALVFEGRALTYEELDAQASRCANALEQAGVGLGDRVALFLPNIPEFVIAYLGILKLGAVAVSLNVMLKYSEVELVLNDCGCVVVITTAHLRGQVPDEGEHVRWGVVVLDQPGPRDLSWDGLMAEAAPQRRAIDLDRDAPAALVYTSGTTERPKGIMLSHGNVISNMYAKNHHCGTRPDDRLLLYLPLFHCFGQNAILNNGLNAGATIVLQRRFHIDQALEAIARERVTQFFGVPTIYIRLLEAQTRPEDLAPVRYYLTAGAPMPTETARAWHDRYGLLINEGYGMTETSPFASYNHDFRYEFGSVGMPIENVEMKVVDPEGQRLAPGEQGEVVIRGPNVMLGYWNRPEETARALVNGWFHTGDVGTVDDAGYFYIVDRIKDTINVAGFKVCPTDVEKVIRQYPAVAEVAVYGVPDAVQGEVVKASIQLRAGYTSTAEEIKSFCRERIAAFKMPHAIEFVDSIPKNATGKVLRRVLRSNAIQADAEGRKA